MTSEDAKCYIRTLLEIGGCDGFDYKQREALNMAIKALGSLRDCKTCKHSENGNCARTEECHECMWESKYEQQTCEEDIHREREQAYMLGYEADGGGADYDT